MSARLFFGRSSQPPTGPAVAYSDRTIFAETLAPEQAVVAYEMNMDGSAAQYIHGVKTLIPGEWLLSGNAGDFEVRAGFAAGVLPDGPIDTWLNLGTTHTWSLSRTTLGRNTSTLWMEIRIMGSATVLDSGWLQLVAEVA